MDKLRRVPSRAYQAVRDLERLLIEERAEALSAAGYPLILADDSDLHAKQRLKEARAAARSSQEGSVSENTASELSARGVSQVIREAIFGRSDMSKVSQKLWNEIYAGHFLVDVEGWRISIYNN
ncbi:MULTISPECIES: hypothetical protein [Pseudomonas]|jgi:hypothetical protein|uniref:DUF7693 family protein n=1 Tax=Pseudomonas veronii TaxID=76761 RepID=UPI001E4AC1E7|nr:MULTISPECIES: hypothetical protein [Pseudomonas]